MVHVRVEVEHVDTEAGAWNSVFFFKWRELSLPSWHVSQPTSISSGRPWPLEAPETLPNPCTYNQPSCQYLRASALRFP